MVLLRDGVYAPHRCTRQQLKATLHQRLTAPVVLRLVLWIKCVGLSPSLQIDVVDLGTIAGRRSMHAAYPGCEVAHNSLYTLGGWHDSRGTMGGVLGLRS